MSTVEHLIQPLYLCFYTSSKCFKPFGSPLGSQSGFVQLLWHMIIDTLSILVQACPSETKLQQIQWLY